MSPGRIRIFKEDDSNKFAVFRVLTNTCTSLGVPWPEIAAITSDTNRTPATIDIRYSFMQAGTVMADEHGGGSSAGVTLQDYSDSSVTHVQFISEVTASLAEWKNAFEHICPWLTMNFINLGDEMTTSVPSGPNDPTYTVGVDNVGDFRFGMHNIDGVNNTLAHGYSPGGTLGSVGNVGGDVHYDSSEDWRLDTTLPSVDYAYSVKYITIHELGHVFGIGHSTEIDSVMYYAASAEWSFHEKFPLGLVGSTLDLACLENIYPISNQ